MDEKRKGEIAYALAKEQIRQSAFNPVSLMRKIEKQARATGIPASELKEFTELVVKELFEETRLGPRK